jgi:hypothetical protein
VQILNLLGWPDTPTRFDSAEREELEGILECRVVLPPGIATERLDPASDFGKFARIRALTAMRQELVAAGQARVCMGGASGKPGRRLPGLVEEALFTYRGRKPLYISSALGGASKAMADAILQRRLSDEARSLFYTEKKLDGTEAVPL